jgi:hypothetical protein
MPVGQSGVYEWFYYEPLLDAMIGPLLFSFAGDHDRETLRSTGVQPAAIFPTQTVYHDLRNHDVQSFVFQDHRYAFSAYTTAITNGATVVPFKTLPEAIVNLLQCVARQPEGRAYYFLYYDNIDSICHLYGPDSPQLAAEIESLLLVLEYLFHAKLSRTHRRTLFLMTADHGQAAIDPATTVYLNRALPQLRHLLKTNRQGQPLVPAGSARDFFLHIKDDVLPEAHGLLREHLAGKAEVCRVDQLIERGFFGNMPPSAALMSRIGNLVILPYEHESVWWHEQGRFDQPFYGHHGGLTPAEMETMLLAMPYGG